MASDGPKTLGDYFTLQRGTTYKSRLLDQPGPVLLGLATIERNGGFRSDSLRSYGGDSPSNLLVQPGELYVSLKDVTQSADLLGAVARLPVGYAPGRLTQDTVKLEPKFEDVPSDYIYWLLRTPQYRAYCRAHATGTTNLGLPRKDFLAFPVPEQTAIHYSIVDTLVALDDKIALNRRMSETLGAMARALFKSWFVDFDPVRAKIQGREPGLPQSLADLFPSSLVHSELGEIPAGWRTYRLDELTVHHTQYTTPSSLPDTEFEHFSIPAYDVSRMPVIEPGVDIKSNKTVVEPDSVLLSKLNPEIPRVWLPDTGSAQQVCSTEFLVFSHRTPANRSLLYSLFIDTEFRRLLQSMVTGTSRSHQRVQPKALKLRLVLSGTPELFRKFDKIAKPVLAQLVKRRTESHTLATLRDALLSRLAPVERDVKDADELVGG